MSKSLAHGIQSGKLSSLAFKRQLFEYQRQLRALANICHLLDFKEYADKREDLELSIKITKLFVDNFTAIEKGK